jgi:hypothetical protein
MTHKAHWIAVIVALVIFGIVPWLLTKWVETACRCPLCERGQEFINLSYGLLCFFGTVALFVWIASRSDT